MGVKGLWKLIEEAGIPVPLESLENKILAVDISIWLHQAVRGYRGVGGQAVANSHILILFHRICKLLFYRIKPVFVFDGGVPQLKKRTITLRRLRREAAANKTQKVRERLLANLLKSQAVRNILGYSGPSPALEKVIPNTKPKLPDMFELPALPENSVLQTTQSSAESSEESGDDEDLHRIKKRKVRKCRHYQNIHNFNLDSEEFLSHSLQEQHEILVDLEESRKDNSWATLNEMPRESNNFSSYQMERLLKRSKFQETIDIVRKSIQKERSLELERLLFGNLEQHVSQTHRIASEDATHSIIVRTKPDAEQEVSVASQSEKQKSAQKDQKDFLQELDKQKIVTPYQLNDSKSDSEYYASDWSNEETENAEMTFIDLLESSEECDDLNQEELFTIATQNHTKESNNYKLDDLNKPSTSNDASGVVASFSSTSSSDEDCDFVDVDEFDSGNAKNCDVLIKDSNYLKSNVSNEFDQSSNVDAIRSSNSSSLYIKIVQQQLDNAAVQFDRTSPKKASFDTRNIRVESQPTTTLTIELDKNTNGPDELFADIFVPNEPFDNAKRNLSLRKASADVQLSSLDEVLPANVVENVLPGPDLLNVSTNSDCDELRSKIDKLVRKQLNELISVTDVSTIARQSNNVQVFHENCSTNRDITEDMDCLSCTVEETSSDLGTSNVESTVEKMNFPVSEDNNHEKYCNDQIMGKRGSSDHCKLNGRSSAKYKLLNLDENSSSLVKETLESDKNKYSLGEQSNEADDNRRSVDLKKFEQELVQEQKTLVAQAQLGERIASNLSQQMYTDAQELLQLFGLPYLVAPMEAEAQCAFLDDVGLTHGTITDDSDAFLFGSKHIYKNFFNQKQFVELYKLETVEAKFCLNREKLIALAILTGSDYTEGIEGIGVVGAMELLSEFPGTGMESLKSFKKWWKAHNCGSFVGKMSKVREKLSKLYLPEGFPNYAIFQAYTEATVDESKEKFSWAVPNVAALRNFAADKLGWCFSKTDEILLPVMKRLSVNTNQLKIDTYFHVTRLVKEPTVSSKRLQVALAKSKNKLDETVSLDGTVQIEESSNASETHLPVPQKHQKHRQKKQQDNFMNKIRRQHALSQKMQLKRSRSLTKFVADRPVKEKINLPVSKTDQGGNSTIKSPSTSAGSLAVENVMSKMQRKQLNYKRLLLNSGLSEQAKVANAEMAAKKKRAAAVLQAKLKKD